MRYSWRVAFATVLLVLYTTLVSAQEALPLCADKCYQLANLQADCTFGNNDCTCSNAAVINELEGCWATSCSMRDFLHAKNTTATVCERPVRDKSYVLVYASTICGSFALLAVLMRVFVAVRQNSFGYDDLCACLASAMAVPNFIGLAISAKEGLGKDMWTLTPEEIQKCLRQIYICQNFYFWCSGFTKLCFLFFFLRIFPSQGARTWCFIGIAISLGYAAGFGFPMTFACWPIPAIWTAWLGESAAPDYCINQNIFYYCAAAVNIASDVLIALIPIPQLWILRFTFKKKMLLLAIFGVGFITIIVSCLRVQSLTQYANTKNPIYDTLSSATWSVIELNVGVFCACMPAFRRFLAHTMPNCFGSIEDESETLAAATGASSKNVRFAAKKGNKKRSTLPTSLFHTTAKTLETQSESTKHDDDELHLVEIGQGTKSVAGSTGESHQGVDSLYCEQHQRTT